MIMMRRWVGVALVALAGCHSGSPAPAPTGAIAPADQGSSLPAPASPPSSAVGLAPTPTPQPTQDQAALDSRDCRTVAQAYADAIERHAFDFAARAWNDPVIDAARLKARFAGFTGPRIEIKKVEEEGAAGSLYCTVTGVLNDTGPNKKTRSGEIVLKRVNDVPGATADQLRWTIRSSTFIEKMERSGKGGAT
jgi:hypothetical protein